MKNKSETTATQAEQSAPPEPLNGEDDDPFALVADLTTLATVHAATMEAATTAAEKKLNALLYAVLSHIASVVIRDECRQLELECQRALEESQKTANKPMEAGEASQAPAKQNAPEAKSNSATPPGAKWFPPRFPKK